ncbi:MULTISPECIES: serine hydrolase [Dactylosporangium]|uniref:Beta-lactamase n=2 Tax=Dactylosporangium TaxID=35753 RepID=A0A9W6NNX2_9ACTN|nr:MULTISPECIES: serine hydrolase [Dactylosporangium]UAB92414.1 serine hydrolase [Dactylosporangium vinaceum]UWZ40868.1 serine hydrolase [Dactylosporangium matsuzakiense]GLL03477.1 serine hydrolase [Dactylosporangium matsuzakiense]
MGTGMSRRAALAAGAGATAALVAGGTAGAAPVKDEFAGVSPEEKIRRVYGRQKAKAGGVWYSNVKRVDAAGTLQHVLEDDADHVVHGYSVQKLAVATAVMDKIDRGQLSLGQKLDLQADIILGGTGIYFLHTVWGDDITVANFLTAMLLVSDNTAVRMCGRVVPALEINDILAAKGFVHTRVEPVANPNRFYLGTTTPHEITDLLTRLANKTLLSANSCTFLLSILRWINGYHDGIRRNMSSEERSRVATKYGADFNDLGAARHEAGIMFGSDGSPALVYGFFAEGLGDLDNYGATHPAVEAHSVLGRTMFDTIKDTTVPGARAKTVVPQFQPVDGG